MDDHQNEQMPIGESRRTFSILMITCEPEDDDNEPPSAQSFRWTGYCWNKDAVTIVPSRPISKSHCLLQGNVAAPLSAHAIVMIDEAGDADTRPVTRI
jgi:hypothetical protein